MTILYKPAKIKSAEQAEALPDGSVAVSNPAAREAFVKDGHSWLHTHSRREFTNGSMIGLEALVPIEAEEQYVAPDAITYSRYVTAWEEA